MMVGWWKDKGKKRGLSVWNEETDPTFELWTQETDRQASFRCRVLKY